MIHIREAEAIGHSGDNYRGIIYPLIDQTINFGTLIIEGRSPSSGYHLNTTCKVALYIVEGTGKITIKNENEIEVTIGDLIFLREGDIYALDGNLKMATACTPAWSIEQHRFIT